MHGSFQRPWDGPRSVQKISWYLGAHMCKKLDGVFLSFDKNPKNFHEITNNEL